MIGLFNVIDIVLGYILVIAILFDILIKFEKINIIN